jgi:hypothetical protein
MKAGSTAMPTNGRHPSEEMVMRKPVSFFSQGVKLVGDLYLPDDLARGEKRAAVLLCHGYTGVRNIYLPDNDPGAQRSRLCRPRFRLPGLGRQRGADDTARVPSTNSSGIVVIAAGLLRRAVMPNSAD